jgi:hypothetical protein
MAHEGTQKDGGGIAARDGKPQQQRTEALPDDEPFPSLDTEPMDRTAYHTPHIETCQTPALLFASSIEIREAVATLDAYSALLVCEGCARWRRAGIICGACGWRNVEESEEAEEDRIEAEAAPRSTVSDISRPLPKHAFRDGPAVSNEDDPAPKHRAPIPPRASRPGPSRS